MAKIVLEKLLLYLGSGGHGERSTRLFGGHKAFMTVNDRWPAVILSAVKVVIAAKWENMDMLKTVITKSYISVFSKKKKKYCLPFFKNVPSRRLRSMFILIKLLDFIHKIL